MVDFKRFVGYRETETQRSAFSELTVNALNVETEMEKDMDHLTTFTRAVQEKRLVGIRTAGSSDKRVCVPFDVSPTRGRRKSDKCFVLYQLEDDGGIGSRLEVELPLLLEIEVLEETFDPQDILGWPSRCNIQRDWGAFAFQRKLSQDFIVG